MSMTKSHKRVIPWVLALILLAGCYLRTTAAPADKTSSVKEDQKKVNDLLKERRDVLREVIKGVRQRIEAGRGIPDETLANTFRMLTQVELELTDNPRERIALLEKNVEMAKEVEAIQKARHDAGVDTLMEYDAAKAALLKAETALLRQQAGEKPSEEQASQIKKRLGERRETLQREIEGRLALVQAGRATVDAYLIDAFRFLLDVQLELAKEPKDRIVAHKAHLGHMKRFEGLSRDQPNNAEIKARCLEAEIGLMTVQIKGNKPTPEESATIKKLQQERRDTVQAALDRSITLLEEGHAVVDSNLVQTCRHLLQAKLDLAEKRDDRIAAHQAFCDFLKRLEDPLRATFEKEQGPYEPYGLIKAARLEGEIDLLRARIKANQSGE
jgi:hypothetical protein